MKKTFTTLAAIMAVVTTSVVLISWNDDDQTLSSSGSVAGYSGDPAGGNQDCTSCHNDGTAITQAGMITSNIPVGGYIAGATYTITAAVTGTTTFGFQNTAQNASGTAMLGTLTPIGITETQLKTKTINTVVFTYITHKATSNTGTGSRSWSYLWTAPATGLGPVTFYGAFNAADGDQTDLNDQIYLSTMVVNENLIGIEQLDSESNISIYPAVSNGQFTIQVSNGQWVAGNQYNLEIYGVTGEKVYQSQISPDSYRDKYQISLDVPGGLYFVWMKTANSNTLRKIVIQ